MALNSDSAKYPFTAQYVQSWQLRFSDKYAVVDTAKTARKSEKSKVNLGYIIVRSIA